MNVGHLRRKGWSEAEIARALKIFAHAEATKHPRIRRMEHLGFWMLILVLTSGSVGTAIELMPLLMFSTLPLSLPIIFLLGMCMGLLLVHVLHDLKLERTHQHVGVSVLLLSCIILVTFTLESLESRFGAEKFNAFFISLPFALGILIPYLVHWRIIHESS